VVPICLVSLNPHTVCPKDVLHLSTSFSLLIINPPGGGGVLEGQHMVFKVAVNLLHNCIIVGLTNVFMYLQDQWSL
jgi:hypothetical protein